MTPSATDSEEAAAKALLAAARSFELLPPRLKREYVSLLRLYAREQWRLEIPESEPIQANLTADRLGIAGDKP